MPTESGYSNQKAFGTPQYKTVHNVGSDKFATNVITKGLIERSSTNLVIESVAKGLGPKNQPTLKITITDHGAKRAGEVLRIYTGELENLELDIINVIDEDNFEIYDVMETIPLMGDEVKIAYFRTPQFDVTGNIITTSGPIQFTKDGASVEVTEDTTDPTNNTPLPAGMYVLIDGVAYPVGKDTIDPSKTVMVPVEISGTSGPINITAGDLNVQLSDAGANFDATRIGDGSGVYLKIEADGSITTNDPSAIIELQNVVSELEDLNATQVSALTALNSIAGEDFATQVTLAALLAAFNAEDFASQTTLALMKTALDTLNGKDFATQVTLAAMSAKLPATLGQKTKANSLAVTMASDQENNQGAFAGDQTQPVTDAVVVLFTPPAGAKSMVISNNAASAGANRVRWTHSANTPSWTGTTRGAILGVGSFTSLIPAGAFNVIAEDNSAVSEVSVAWF